MCHPAFFFSYADQTSLLRVEVFGFLLPLVHPAHLFQQCKVSF
jgi:hypothetical protein